jgi:hypothetical protein
MTTEDISKPLNVQDAKERKQLAWLWELLSMKKRHLPELAFIWLEERIKAPRGFEYDRLPMPPAPPLAEALHDAGVKFRLWLRIPLIGEECPGMDR